METRTAAVNGLDIAYETFGEATDPPILLVMGLGTQMIAWPDEMCEELAAAGHFVIRFDNRDVGLSTHLRGVTAPRPLATFARRQSPPYTIDDMAGDAFGLLDALGIESAHVAGASMGGFIAQTMALLSPQRVRSLALIMTSTGSRRVGMPSPKLFVRMMKGRAPVDGRESAITQSLDVMRMIGSPGYPFDTAYLRDLAERSYDRAYDPGGYLRQVAAVSSQPDRTQGLRRLVVPTVVIHGLDDPLVAPSGGLALAKAIRGSTFVGIPGMGHDLPRPLWTLYARELIENARRVKVPGDASR